MASRAVLAVPEPKLARWLTDTLGDQIRVSLCASCSPDEVIAHIEQESGLDLVFVQADEGAGADGPRLIRSLVERYPQLTVLAVGAQGPAEAVLAAVRAGAADFLVRDRDDEQLLSLVSTAVHKRGGGAARTVDGRLIGVMAGHGYDGIAFFAEHLALAFQQQREPGQRVVLVDAAQPAGASTVYLNITQSYTLLDALSDVHRCDQTLVDSAFTKHDSGLFVLSLPEDLIGVPGLDGNALLELLGVFRRLFSVTVLTLDPSMPIASMAALVEACDRMIVLSDQSILKSRHNKYLLRALRLADCRLDHTGLVVDNYRRRLGLEPRSLAQLLELPLLATLSGSGLQRIRAMNSGEPLFEVAPRDAYCRDIVELARAMMSGQTLAPRPRGLIERLIG